VIDEEMTVAEAAAYMRESNRTVLRLLGKGHLRGIKKRGRGWLVPRSEVEAFLFVEDVAPPSAAVGTRRPPTRARAGNGTRGAPLRLNPILGGGAKPRA
jgi:excisionase family DNA binding protein